VRRADLGDVDLELGLLPDERAGGAGVVEMDVAEEQVVDVGEREPAPREASLQCRDGGGRAAVEEREAVVGLDQVAADDALGAEVVEVDEVGDPAIVAGSPTRGSGCRCLARAATEDDRSRCGEQQGGGQQAD